MSAETSSDSVLLAVQTPEPASSSVGKLLDCIQKRNYCCTVCTSFWRDVAAAVSSHSGSVDATIGKLEPILDTTVDCDCGNCPLDVILDICVDLYDDFESSGTLQSFRVAIKLLHPLAARFGFERMQLQRLLTLLRPDRAEVVATAASSIKYERWLAVLAALQELSGVAALPMISPQMLPRIALRNGQCLRGCSGGCGDSRRLPGLQFHAPSISYADTGEVIHRCIFSRTGVTLGAWVFLHNIPLDSEVCRSTTSPSLRDHSKSVYRGSFWWCREPNFGGWDIQAWCSGDVEILDVYFVQLGSAENDTREQTPVHLGVVPAMQWIALTITIEFNARRCSSSRIRLQRDQWVHVELGANPVNSKFPAPPCALVAEDAEDLDDSYVASRTAGGRDASGVAFFDHLQVDVVSLWIFEGIDDACVASWLSSTCEHASSKNRNQYDVVPRGDHQILAKAILGFLPGDADDVVNCVVVSNGSSRNQNFRGSTSGLELDETSVGTSSTTSKRPSKHRQAHGGGLGPLAAHITSTACLSSMLWALAGQLPHSIASEIHHIKPLVLELIHRTFHIVARVVAHLAIRRDNGGASAATHSERDRSVNGSRFEGHGASESSHFFVEDGGFAIWSYVLWRRIDPDWIEIRTGELLSDFVISIAGDVAVLEDCCAQLLGPHMSRFWSRTQLNVQRLLWSSLYKVCNEQNWPSLLLALGGPECLLHDACSCADELEILCLKLVILFEHTNLDDLSLLWVILGAFPSWHHLPARHVQAILVAVNSLVLPKLLSTAMDKEANRRSRRHQEAAAEAFALLCSHTDLHVCAEAVWGLWQLESCAKHRNQIVAAVSPLQLETALARLQPTRQGGRAAGRLEVYSVLWGWFQNRRVQTNSWDWKQSMDVKIQFLGAQVSAHIAQVVSSKEQFREARWPPPGRSHGAQLLRAIVAVLAGDAVGDDDHDVSSKQELELHSLRVRFLQDLRLLLGCASEHASAWWLELRSCRDSWQHFLLTLSHKCLDDDECFSAGLKLHMTILSSALMIDADAWEALRDMIIWATSLPTPVVKNGAVIVCRCHLAQLFELVAMSFKESVREAARRSEHPLATNLIRIAPALHEFLTVPTEASGVSRWPHLPRTWRELPGAPPHVNLRLCQQARTSVASGSSNQDWNVFGAAPVWLDYAVAAQFVRLIGMALDDPLQGQPVIGFDLGSWVSSRWHRRSFPLDGNTEHLILGQLPDQGLGAGSFSDVSVDSNASSSTGGGAAQASATSVGHGGTTGRGFLFTHLLYWGTRCLLYRPPSESELTSEQVSQVGGFTSCSGHLCAAVIGCAGMPQDANAQSRSHYINEIFTALRRLTMSLLAIGSHGSSPLLAGAQDDIILAVLSFCAHASIFADTRSVSKNHAAESKLWSREAKEHAADVFLLMLLLCCQKWGRPAAGFTEADLRDCAGNGAFPCGALRLLPELKMSKVASDLRELFARQPSTKAWLRSSTQWLDPVGAMQGSLLSFVFQPASTGQRSSGSGQHRTRGSGGGSGQTGVSETWMRHQVLERWGFREALASSPQSGATFAFLEPFGHGCHLPALDPDQSAPKLSLPAARSGPSGYGASSSLQAFVERSQARNRRLRRLRRGWTNSAWRTLCHSNQAPGSVWHCPVHWRHPAPPLPCVQHGRIGETLDPKQNTSDDIWSAARDLVDESYAEWWSGSYRQSSAACSASSSACSEDHTIDRLERHWTVSRVGSGGRRAFLRCRFESECDLSSGDGSESNSSGSSAAPPQRHRSDEGDGSSEDSSDPDGPVLLKARCTWIRREGHREVILRLRPSAMQINLCEDHVVASNQKVSSQSKSRHHHGQRSRADSHESSSSSVAPVETTNLEPAPSTKPACRRSRKRRSWRFPIQGIADDGIHPRHFLHRPSALEIEFLHGSAPLRLHFDEETPAPTCHDPVVAKDSWHHVAEADSADDMVAQSGFIASFGNYRAAAAALLGRTLFGSQRCAEVSLRDEVWLRIATLQQHLRDVEEGAENAVQTNSFAGSSATAARQYEPSQAWTRAAGCKNSRRRRSSLCVGQSCTEPVAAVSSVGAPAAAASGTGPRSHATNGLHMVDCTADIEAQGGSSSDQHKHASVEHRKHLMHAPIQPADARRLNRRHDEYIETRRESLTCKWQKGEISNFAYLQSLNHLSGRSLDDLSQYPVMPWILCLSQTQHTETPSVIIARGEEGEIQQFFRDLSRTLGDLGSPSRRKLLQEKFSLAADLEHPPYHYGTHYSTPAFVMHFLIRLQPFSRLARALQGGKYDVPDRLFNSLRECWRSCTTEMSDVRELTPELFVLPECLLNINNIDLGVRQDGVKVGDVELPAWASDAHHFIHEHRLALESGPVSSTLHLWLDLIFGFKQVGPAAKDALNVFFPLTYGVDWASVEPGLRHSQEQQVMHFGQTPRRLFGNPHPARSPEESWRPSLLPHSAFVGASVLQAQASHDEESDEEEIDSDDYVHPGASPYVRLACWHSSSITSASVGIHLLRPDLQQPRWHQNPVVAIVPTLASAPAGTARLFVVQSDGTLRCYNVRRALAGAGVTSTPPSLVRGGSASATASNSEASARRGSRRGGYSASSSSVHRLARSGGQSGYYTAPSSARSSASGNGLEVCFEASFALPRASTDGIEELLLADHRYAHTSAAWAFLAERRIFARGGFRDGSIVVGCCGGRSSNDEKPGAVTLQGPARGSRRLAAAPVTAIALAGPEEDGSPCGHCMPEACRRGLLLFVGFADGALSLWTAADGSWCNFVCVSRWHIHLSTVRCVVIASSCSPLPGTALSGGDDGLVNLIRLRPPMRPERTFQFADRAPIGQVRFGSRAPATIVASSTAPPARICVWALHGYLIASVELPDNLWIRNLQVISENDSHEGLLCTTAADASTSISRRGGNGAVELRTLPYLHQVWRHKCHWSLRPTALYSATGTSTGGIAWLGLEDGTFEAVFPGSLLPQTFATGQPDSEAGQ